MNKKMVLTNLWIDRNSGYFDFIILTSISISIILMIFLKGLFILIPICILLCISGFAIQRKKWVNNRIDLRDYFTIPEKGDVLTIIDNDEFNIYLYYNTSSTYHNYKNGDEIKVEGVVIGDANIKLSFYCNHCGLNNLYYTIDWYRTRKLLKTKSDIRNIKLKSLGI